MSEVKIPESAEVLNGLFRTLMEQSRSLENEFQRPNERLRKKLDDFCGDLTRAGSLVSSEYETVRKDQGRLRKEAAELEIENSRFARRCAELEDHLTNLTNLYAATVQLHASLDPDTVIQNIVEILVNQIGAAEFFIYLVDESTGDFAVVACEEGVPLQGLRQPELVQPVERLAIKLRRTAFVEEISRGPEIATEPICCAPLYFHEQLVGALSVYALLSHKAAFSNLDRELFDLLGEQAALAIVSSRAFVSVERKLKTMQRFMDLLKG